MSKKDKGLHYLCIECGKTLMPSHHMVCDKCKSKKLTLSMWFKKIRYKCWVNWYLANFKFSSFELFIAKLRVLTVYDPAFKKGGIEQVKKEHRDHLEKIEKFMKETKVKEISNE